MANGNGNNNKIDQIITLIQKLGLPTFFAIALGAVMIRYWIAPQTDLIQAMSDNNKIMSQNNKQLSVAVDALTDSININKDQLMKLNKASQDQIELLQQQTNYLESVQETHEQQLQDHRDILTCLEELHKHGG